MAEVQRMWEMACVLEFLDTFKADLDMRCSPGSPLPPSRLCAPLPLTPAGAIQA